MDFVTWLRAEWDRVAGVTLIVVGAIALLVGYDGVSESPYLAEQMAYVVSGGLGGLLLAGVGATLLVCADIEDEWRKLDRIEALLRGQLVDATAPDASAATNGAGSPSVAVDATGAPEATANGHPTPRRRARPLRTEAGRIRTDAALVGAGLVVPVAFLATGWHRAATVADLEEALDGVALAVVGLVVFGVAAVVATLTGKYRVRRRQDELWAPFVLRHLAAKTELPVFVSGGTTAEPARRRVLVADGLSRYHAPGCAATNGIVAREVDLDAAPAALAPCRLCLPA